MGILVAIGGDDDYETVLAVALRLADGWNDGLRVVHVTATESASTDERAFRDELRAFLSEADPSAEVALEHLDRSGLRSGTAVGKQLLELAEDVDTDHIVLGHHSKTRFRTVREGHTDFTVVDEATVPVTIVPEGVEV